jgi:hypothetical protein
LKNFEIIEEEDSIMLRDINHMKGFRIHAIDGDIGHVKEFYFDDHKWIIRYLVTDTGRFLPGKIVLLSPEAISSQDWKEKKFLVNLTKEQIKNSPGIDEHMPVTRQHEHELHRYYGWEKYWNDNSELIVGENIQSDGSLHAGDSHLLSTDFLSGFFIHAVDGEFGRLDDFIVDEDSWSIRFLVIGSQHWVTGKKALVCPDWIKKINFSERTVFINLIKEKLQTAPEYDPSVQISRDYEEKLFDHYGCKKYWL